MAQTSLNSYFGTRRKRFEDHGSSKTRKLAESSCVAPLTDASDPRAVPPDRSVHGTSSAKRLPAAQRDRRKVQRRLASSRKATPSSARGRTTGGDDLDGENPLPPPVSSPARGGPSTVKAAPPTEENGSNAVTPTPSPTPSPLKPPRASPRGPERSDLPSSPVKKSKTPLSSPAVSSPKLSPMPKAAAKSPPKFESRGAALVRLAKGKKTTASPLQQRHSAPSPAPMEGHRVRKVTKAKRRLLVGDDPALRQEPKTDDASVGCEGESGTADGDMVRGLQSLTARELAKKTAHEEALPSGSPSRCRGLKSPGKRRLDCMSS